MTHVFMLLFVIIVNLVNVRYSSRVITSLSVSAPANPKPNHDP